MVSLAMQVPSRTFTWGRRLPHEVQVGSFIVAVVAIASLLAPLLAPHDPNQVDVLNSLEGPSAAHWMGTDDVGRDLFSRVLYGTRADLLAVVAVTLIGLTFGTLVGTLAGYFGRWVDIVVSRTGDMVVSFPFLLVILTVV